MARTTNGEGGRGGVPGRSDPCTAEAETEDERLALKLWTVLSRAQSAMESHSVADIRRHDLTPGEFGVLEALHHKGPLQLGELQRKILVSSGGMTYLVDRLAERGLVERRPDPKDRRASFARLTRDGAALIRRIFPKHRRCIERAASGLGPKEKQDAIRLLRKLGLEAARLSQESIRTRDRGDEP